MTSHRPPDLIRQLLSVLTLLVLIGGSLWVMQPFVAPLIWAAMITVATWPTLLWLQRHLGNRRGLATLAMLLLLLLGLFVPLTLAIVTMVSHADEALEWLKGLDPSQMIDPPAWVASLPMVGERVAQAWRDTVQGGGAALAAKLTPYAGTLAKAALRQVGALGAVGLQFLLTVAICGVLYLQGEIGARGVTRFAHRLAGERGVRMVHLAAHAARGVALGVVVTAVAQAVLGGIGVAVAGVPGAMVLTTIMFLLTIAQIGPLPVLLSCCGWLLWSGHTGAAIGLLLWSGVVGTIDNLLRPWLIRKGADLPLLLIFAGVIGGLMAFGLLGIFIGPVVLAVTYTLMGSWMDEETGADAEPVSRAATETLKQEDALRSPASGDSP